MILIIGAGLSGLVTALRLKKEGIPFKILEARARIGGRINTVSGTQNTTVEMGATWFNNQHTHLKSLLEELKIEYFEQYMDGTIFFQPLATMPAESIKIPTQEPSFRISGGTSNLIKTLYKRLDLKDVLLNQTVKEIKFHKNSVQVITNEIFEGDKVVLAIPPKLWAKNILFVPNLPDNLIHIATQTHTWMEDSIKIALIYKKPFWQQKNLSGALFSNAGPVIELYDHCNHDRSKYALCGFISTSFKQFDYADRRKSVIMQLKAVFGEKAGDFINYEECVWSKEENTFVKSEIALFPHQNNGNQIFSESFMDDKLLISSSESASEFSGYMDGAVYSGIITAKRIIAANKP